MSKYKIVKMNKRLDGIDKDYTLRNGLGYSIKSTMLTKINEFNEVIAIDTETYKGTCKLIYIAGCNNLGKPISLIINNIIDPSFDDCIRMMTYHSNNKGVYRFFWNIDFDVQAILKLYDKKDKLDFVDKLSKGIPMEYTDFRGVSYIFKWIRGRMFTISFKNKHCNIVYTDLFLFYNLGLGIAGKKYLNESKLDIIDAKRLNTDISYWKHKYDIIKYCRKDAILTMKLGLYLIESIKNVDLALPKYLVSPASLSKTNYRQNNQIYNLRKTPIEIIQIGFDVYRGGRFELFNRGFFEKSYLYDIVSEYPFFIRTLPDMFNGVWIRREGKITLPKHIPLLAFYKVKLDIPLDVKVSTIAIKQKSGIVAFPVGIIDDWFTWYDLDLMREYIIEITDCYEYRGYSSEYKNRTGKKMIFPFKEMTDKLFEQKKSLDKKINLMEYNTVKITMNAIYGCTIESHDIITLDDDNNEVKKITSGILFNPIYASHITSFGRWKLFKDVPKDKWNNILAVHTDSIITDIDMSEYLNIGNKLGQWNLEAKGKCILINTGMYQIGYIVKTRGIPIRFIKNWLRFCLKYGNYDSKSFKIKKMKKVRSAIIQDKSLIDMNVMIDVERSVSVNSDTKRSWYNDFDNFNDLLSKNIDSLPIYYSEKEFSPNPLVLSKKIGMDVDFWKNVSKNKDDLF